MPRKTTKKPARVDAAPEIPRVVTKSMAAAMQCEHYFGNQYLPATTAKDLPSAVRDDGNDFHAYRSAYINHLREVGAFQDPGWVEDWLHQHPNLSVNARTIISQDIDSFRVNPEAVFGTELFLSISGGFTPLEQDTGRAPGQASKHPDALASGQLDCLLIDQGVATVLDPKSGFSAVGVTDEEPFIYATLVFAHFPRVHTVRFIWDFVRLNANKQAEFVREDLEWLKPKVLEIAARKQAIIDKLRAGAPLATNKWAGLCGYCTINCPERAASIGASAAISSNGDAVLQIEVHPIQTDEDARKVAGAIYLCSQFLLQARPMLRDWIAARQNELEGGRLPLGGDFVAENRSAIKATYPLRRVLDALGCNIVDTDRFVAALVQAINQTPTLASDIASPEGAAEFAASLKDIIRTRNVEATPLYDVPLASLTLSSSALNGYAGTKKSRRGVSRQGLAELLDLIAKRYPIRSGVVIRKLSESERIASLNLEQQLQDSINAVED